MNSPGTLTHVNNSWDILCSATFGSAILRNEICLCGLTDATDASQEKSREEYESAVPCSFVVSVCTEKMKLKQMNSIRRLYVDS